MNISKEGTTPNQPPAYSSHPGSRQDEINLLDIWQALKRQWKLIIAIIFLFTFLALIVALMMTKVFRVEVSLLPPPESDVELLNVSEFYEITSKDLYESMIRNLKSKHLRHQFFDEHKLLGELKGARDSGSTTYEIFRKRFDEMLLVDEDGDFVSITLDGGNPEQIVQWLNNYVIMVNEYTVQSVVNTIKAKSRGQISILHNKIQSLRITAEKYRQDKLIQLGEALSIAKNLDIKKQQAESSDFYDQSDRRDLGLLNKTKVMSNYLKGDKLLRAEIAELKNRKNDDPFISSLRELQGKISYLESIDLQYSDIHAARIDQKAVVADKPIKPNHKLIVVLGFLVGLITAIFVSLIRSSVLCTREKT